MSFPNVASGCSDGDGIGDDCDAEVTDYSLELASDASRCRQSREGLY